MSSGGQLWKSLINHVFLPSKLPGRIDRNKEEVELRLLEIFSKQLSSLKVGQEGEECIYPKTKLGFEKWKTNQSKYLDPKLIRDEIKELNPGEFFAFYIQAQNCSITISVPSRCSSEDSNANSDDETNEYFPEKAIFSTFIASQKSHIVTLNNDLATTFPSTSVVVPRSQYLSSLCFAKQISDLYLYEIQESKSKTVKANQVQNEIREIVDPKFVIKWLTSALANHESRHSNETEYPRIIKKIRDCVVFEDTVEPWRRSPLYSCLKSICQISLIQECGKIEGNLLYKMIMIHFQTHILDGLGVSNLSQVVLLVEMMGKISRRVHKLSVYFSNKFGAGGASNKKAIVIRESIQSAYKSLIEDVTNKIRAKQNDLTKHWKELIDSTKLLFKQDMLINFPKFITKHSMHMSGFKEYLSTEHHSSFMSQGVKIPPIILRHINPFERFEFELFSCINENNGALLIYDFEIHVLEAFSKQITINDTVYMWSIFQEYIRHAKVFYEGDAVGTSRMILTCLKMIQIWDRLVSYSHPMIAEHNSGIDLDLFGHHLQCPQMKELRQLDHVELYFENRNENASYPSLIEESKVTCDSFGARFAEKDLNCCFIRTRILENGKHFEDRKLQEVKFRRHEWEQLVKEISAMECEYIYREGWFRTHSRSCNKCEKTKIERDLRVNIFETPLPIIEFEQYAIVFELQIPSAIAVLRDLLYLFNTCVIERMPYKKAQCLMYGPWTKNLSLAEFNRRECKWFYNLFSLKKSFIQTHYKELHPSNPDSDFIRQNGMTCNYGVTAFEKELEIKLHQFEEKTENYQTNEFNNLKRMTTFKVQPKSQYSNLQWAINGREKSSNEVLATQYQCHKDLNRLEYVAFGHLRCYYALQYRNMILEFTKQNLSLKNISVLNLILQSVYQASPRLSDRNTNTGNAVLRQAHQDFEDSNFSMEFINLLERMLNQYKGNWKDHNVLITIITLCLRIASICEDPLIHDKCLNILSHCRKVATDWSQSVQTILGNLNDITRKEIDEYRIKIIELNICVCLTFGLESSLLQYVFRPSHQEENVTYFLMSLAKIFDNQALASSGLKIKIDVDLRNLLRRVQEIAVQIQKILTIIFSHGYFSGLNCFVRKHYAAGCRDTLLMDLTQWKHYENNEHIYYTSVSSSASNFNFGPTETVFQMDVITGCFLVDGSPVKNLPSEIESHRDFQLVFPNKLFTVQPFAFNPGRMITVDKWNDSYYSFYLKQDSELIITEHRGTEKWLYVPNNYMRKNISNLLVKNFSHWFNKDKELIEFYPREDQLASKLRIKNPSYLLQLKNMEIAELRYQKVAQNEQVKHSRLLIDINCTTHQDIVRIFRRLEIPKYINIWTDENFTYAVELPRLGLSFSVKDLNYGRTTLEFVNTNRRGGRNRGQGGKYFNNRENDQKREYQIMSKEYRGMKISSERPESLIGLWNGLLLEDADINSKSKNRQIFLVPYGKVVINGPNQVSIVIEESSKAELRFFAYEIDNYLKQFKAGESCLAWLYLAYLHALTATPLIEPFSKLTGADSAFQILKSGHVWSGEPFDKEILSILNDIAALSPIRNYYPEHKKNMERVFFKEFLQDIPNDGYYLIVTKLLEDSLRLLNLYPKFNPDIYEQAIQFKTDIDLCTRAYWSRVKYSTAITNLSDFDSIYLLENSPKIISPLSFDMSFANGDTMESTFEICKLNHDWKTPCYYGPSTNVKGVLKNLLMGIVNGHGSISLSQDLSGVSECGFPVKESIRVWSNYIFKNGFLDLYNVARKVNRKEKYPEWLFITSSLAFRSFDTVSIVHLKILQTIAKYSEKFLDLNPPKFHEYFETREIDFDPKKAEEILLKHARPLENFLDEMANLRELHESIEDFVKIMKEEREKKAKDQVEFFVKFVHEKLWPVESLDLGHEAFLMAQSKLDEIIFQPALNELNISIKHWYQNRELNAFLNEVEERICKIWAEESKRAKILIGTENDNFEYAKKLDMPNHQNALNNLLKKKRKPATIDLIGILKGKSKHLIKKGLWDKAKLSYYNFNQSRNKINTSGPNKRRSHTEDFPLKMQIDGPIIEEYIDNLKRSWNLKDDLGGNFKQHVDTIYSLKGDRSRLLEDIRRENLETWIDIRQAMSPSISPESDEYESILRIIHLGGMYPRINQFTAFRLLIDEKFLNACSDVDSEYLEYIHDLIGGYGVKLTQEMQLARMVRLLNVKKGKTFSEVEYRKESDNFGGHLNWKPYLAPAWLLFEIDMDLMIRDVQIKVAEKMLTPDDDKNSLLQLNMGEGKTAVIVPLLVLSLANGDQLCRVTVLKSLYEINRKALLTRIGGLNGRRVYNLPCRRDYKISAEDIEMMLDVYNECLDKQGVVITIPEHRLSFELKMYEKCGNGSYEVGSLLFKVQDWLKQNCRDILDESDEILQVKYQLIYTLGEQIQIGGGSLRWKIIQNVLTIVPDILNILKERHGRTCVEIKYRGGLHEFPFCRILDMKYDTELADLIADTIIHGRAGIIPEVKNSHKQLVKEFLTNNQLKREGFEMIYKIYPQVALQETLLVLRGLLAAGVLACSLNKRWRVNYGVNPTGYRRMAVPFRAKDVASERTEFGHPDVAILLTNLTYFYSGLSDQQLEQCFTRLLLLPDPSEEYQRWIDLIPESKLPGFHLIKHLSGINLQDHDQRNKILFPALRYNIQTINFWLGSVVYPAESKQFGLKIGASPWDLCRVNTTSNPTTGFSGTSDTRLLLPATIKQNDLTELQGTDGFVLQNLLKKENDTYEALPEGITGKRILEKLTEQNIRVLLDVGALLLELNNRQVADTWLDMVEEADAAVYFDDNDKLMVIERTTGFRPIPLELSTFRTRLDRCVIYLDDIHTRGTDLKIPEGSRACVTLGKGVTKDKLVQGCMRMRKLGMGHSVSFYASQEVHNAILSIYISNIHGSREESKKISQIGVREVLKWSIENNIAAIKSGFIHWISAGVYQAQKQSAHNIYSKSKGKSKSASEQSLKLLSENCNQKEIVELKAMYGEPRVEKSYPVIVEHLLKRVNRILEKQLKGNALKGEVTNIVEFFGKTVKEHTVKYVSDESKCTQLLDEEQERELEHEMEAQHEKEVPTKVKSHDHKSSPEVATFIRTGSLVGIEKWAVKLPLTLYDSQIWKTINSDTWAPGIYATDDFNRVVKPNPQITVKSDDFLRPPNWFVTVTVEGKKPVILFISPYEVDLYMNIFRGRKCVGTLRIFAPRLYPDQDILYLNPKIAIPSTKSWPNSNMITVPMHSCLLLYSGTSYFASMKELIAFCAYMGLCPQNMRKLEDFENGGIVNGFVRKDYRALISEDYEKYCYFDENPQEFIRKIIEGRFKSFSTSSHIGILVMRDTLPKIIPNSSRN